MPRETYQRHLREIQDEVMEMGGTVEKALEWSMQALKNRDLELAKKVVDNDKEIDKKRFAIEEQALDLMSTQAPMASDLRILLATLSVITDLERMADHAAGNAKVAILIGDEPPLKPLIDLPRMNEIVIDMLHKSLDAFIHHDAEAARQIVSRDDEIDHLYDQVFRELLIFMMEDPRTITRAERLIWVGHNLERTGDRVTNICERVVFMVTGKMEEMNISTY
ncbi:MAG: phosphate signaling complex protein PhoU [Dehalococcoidia bacterium]|nr:phosphate signaling complex protein PhoU [Dehalococcoidia bacterium]MDD5493355.1 phosphate signaling complex protein PhoU [Dehalococcoidia bacterium]